MTLSIVCPGRDPEPWRLALKQVDRSLDVQIWPNERAKEDVEFALCWDQPEGVLRDYTQLKCICSMGAGVDHLLKDHSLPHNIPVVRIVGPSLAASMFEYIRAAALYFQRDLDVYNRQQALMYWQAHPHNLVAGTTVGVMGLGKLGDYVATRLKEAGFNVLGWSREPKLIDGVITYTEQRLHEFVSEVNILVCLLPLTRQTRGILSASLFSRLPAGACLINVARGEHLVETDLLAALDSGQLRGACLDVFAQEPLPQDHPFWHHEKVLVTPHCASVTDPEAVAAQIVQNYRLMHSGGALMNEVNVDRGY